MYWKRTTVLKSVGRRYKYTYVDTHTHIDTTLRRLKLNLNDFPKFQQTSFPSTLDAAIQICCDVNAFNETYKLMEYDQIYAAFGIHPHHATQYNNQVEKNLIEAMKHPKTVAWGEMGLDYHYTYAPKELQKEVFEQQIKCALKVNKPLVIHTREAEEDTLAIMKAHIPTDHPIHVHCFTSSLSFAEQILEYWSHLYIGFTGVITFASALDKVVRRVPLERILVETDAPFMTPVPHRGKVCHSGYIPLILDKIAQLKKIDSPTVYQTIRKNTKQIYRV